MTEPTDDELDAVLCNQWPAFSMQATLVRAWVRAAMRDALAKWGTPPAVAGEPVAWQSRTRPTWDGDNGPWSPWEPCTKGLAEDCWKTPLLHDWAYEARALYTAPPPLPASQGDALQPVVALQEIAGMYADDFTPQADSVTAPAAGAVAHTLSDAQIEAMPVWRNFVGLWPESRREIVDAVVDLLAAAPTPPTQAADSVLEDAARYRWLRDPRLAAGQGSITVELDDRANGHFSRSIFLTELDAAIDAARAAQESK